MVNWKKIGWNLLYPHLAVIILLAPISIAFLIFSLIYYDEVSIVAVISYLLAFYVLIVVCFRIPRIISYFKKLKNENRHLKRYFSDVNLRINISLYGSLIWNVAFAIFQLWLGFYQSSVWFYSMFAYYVILAVMRFFLVKHTTNYRPAEESKMELKKSSICAYLLLLMNLALAAIIVLVVFQQKIFHYHEITTITLAAYTFTTFTFAIVNIVKYKKYNSPVYTTAKIITLIAACVSMFTLETAMLTTFGGTADFDSIWLLGFSGLALAIATISIPIYMIVANVKKLKSLKVENVEEI